MAGAEWLHPPSIRTQDRVGLLRYPIILDVFFFKILDEKLLQHSRKFIIDKLIEKNQAKIL